MRNYKKLIIAIIALTALATIAVVGLSGCTEKKIDGTYESEYGTMMKITGNTIRQYIIDENTLNDETTFTRDGDKLVLAEKLGNQYYEFTITKEGDLVGKFINTVSGKEETITYKKQN